MWGNLTLASTEKKDVLVPCLKAGHVGVVSVEFIAPTLEGTYTSHWRLSHKGQQFGPRVWCSIIVDPFPSSESPDNVEGDRISSSKADDFSCEQEVSTWAIGPGPGYFLSHRNVRLVTRAYIVVHALRRLKQEYCRLKTSSC